MITRNTKSNYEPDFESGEVILIDKNFRKSSFDIVYKIRKAVGVKKVGHAGTLDPMATGLVIVCTGKMTKEINTFLNLEKTYTGIISLGKTTSSFDLETEFNLETSLENVTEEKIFKARDSFLGNIFQLPPMYSAIKKNGIALYQFARNGVEVNRDVRQVYLSKFEITKISLPDVHFEICCSKGTYIRVIAHDFGQLLGCGAYLKELRRTGIGNFRVEDALLIDEFKEFVKNYSVAVNSD